MSASSQRQHGQRLGAHLTSNMCQARDHQTESKLLPCHQDKPLKRTTRRMQTQSNNRDNDPSSCKYCPANRLGRCLWEWVKKDSQQSRSMQPHEAMAAGAKPCRSWNANSLPLVKKPQVFELMMRSLLRSSIDANGGIGESVTLGDTAPLCTLLASSTADVATGGCHGVFCGRPHAPKRANAAAAKTAFLSTIALVLNTSRY
jgi:hypothetical protein